MCPVSAAPAAATPPPGFTGQVALVTGASGGIGRAVAARFAAAGAAVAVHYMANSRGADAVAAGILAAGGRAIVVGGDVSLPEDAARIVAETVAAFGQIDILVNNAGILDVGPFGSLNAAGVQRQFAVNTLSVVLMMQAAVPHFPAQGGRVVNVATNLSFGPLPGCAVYTASKSAVIALTEGFARELGGRGVTVNAVAPGATDTPMTAWLTAEMRAGIAGSTPLGRIGQPDDVADVVLFLASDAARWMTGRTLIVDGGLVG